MWSESGRGESRFTVRGLLANVMCSQAVLDFLSNMDVGSVVPAEEDAGSEVSECELGERSEREVERRRASEDLITGVNEQLFHSTPLFMDSTGEVK